MSSLPGGGDDFQHHQQGCQLYHPHYQDQAASFVPLVAQEAGQQQYHCPSVGTGDGGGEVASHLVSDDCYCAAQPPSEVWHEQYGGNGGGGGGGGGEEYLPQYGQQTTFQEQHMEETNVATTACQEGTVSSTEVNQGRQRTTTAKKAKSGKIGSSKKASVKKKSCYKHVPHSVKPPHLVAKRNARERRRVHAVNLAFLKLRRAVPFENKRGKRISKVRILNRALDYIGRLRAMIAEADGRKKEEDAEMFWSRRDDDSLLFDF